MLLNYQRAVEKMRSQKLDALVASSCENVNYCATFETNSTYRYKYGKIQVHCVLFRDDILKPVLIIPVDLLGHLAVQPSWVQDVRTYGTFYIYGADQKKLGGPEAQYTYYLNTVRNYGSAVEGLVDVIREKKLEKARIGLDENNLPPNSWERIISSLPNAEVVKAGGIFKDIRMVKTGKEIQILSEAAQVNDQAFRDLLNTVREGVGEIDLMRQYRMFVTSRGAFFGFNTTGCGTRGGGLFPVPPSNYILKKGDSIRYDAGCIYQGYWSDTARTIFLGEPSSKQLKYFNAIFSGILAAESILKAGVRVSGVFSLAMKAVRENGIPEYNRHHLGHSMGLETYEPPMIKPSDRPVDSDVYLPESGEMRLEENMVVNVECPYYDFQVGGFQFEETYLIRKDGYVRISSLDRGPYIISRS
jgi:Xaa-Pro dipeptidase